MQIFKYCRFDRLLGRIGFVKWRPDSDFGGLGQNTR